MFTQKKEKINFYIPVDLNQSINEVAKELNENVSELLRIAVREFLERYEREKLKRELEEGYKANYDYYLKTNDEFQYADSE